MDNRDANAASLATALAERASAAAVNTGPPEHNSPEAARRTASPEDKFKGGAGAAAATPWCTGAASDAADVEPVDGDADGEASASSKSGDDDAIEDEDG